MKEVHERRLPKNSHTAQIHTSCSLSSGTRQGPQSAAARKRSQPQSSPSFPTSSHRPLGPTFRANLFPEVTDLFCRLPLPTLFYQLEAVHLGDLLRLSVRTGAKIIHSLGFSRSVGSTPDSTEVPSSTGHQTPSPSKSISRSQTVKEKRKLFPGPPPASPSSVALPLKIRIPVPES